MQTAFELVRRAANRSPDADAIVDVGSGASITYRELLEMIEYKAAGFVTRNICAGQRIAVVLPNSIAAYVAILALHRAGAVPALMNPRFKPAEVVSLIQQGKMSACVINADGSMYDELRAELGSEFPVFVLEDCDGLGAIPFKDIDTGDLRELEPHAPNPKDPAFIFYTSGTTGLPKAVVIPQQAPSHASCLWRRSAGTPLGGIIE